MTRWLVTGGAGYIGAHVVRALLASGREVVVLDDLSSGVSTKVPDGVPLVRCSVGDKPAVAAALRDHRVDGVVHLAAKKAAGESVDIPLHYYYENVSGLATLLHAMQKAEVSRMVFSSSAAVYGTPPQNPIDEHSPLAPESPYGETKVVGEWMVRDQGRAVGLSWVALRYFNVAGAGEHDLGDPSVNNLIPMVFRALADGRRPQIFGDDYPTPDGTCIRDYIHVVDLAAAHVAAVERSESRMAADVYNVGRGVGSSVREVMNKVSKVIGRDVNAEVVGRRAGDPPASYAATELITRELGWQAQHGLTDMVTSAWSAWPDKG
ncbi:MAG: UDP-glucose 4-epimerase GalE [Actinomycetes bacterium]|jgi:UDP-glucose 4-epimerase